MCAKVHFVSDVDVSGYTHLTAKHTPFAYFGGTGYAHLGRHYRMRTDFIIMCHLHQIIQFYTAVNDSRSHRGTVYTRIGADFHIVFQ